jgi:hypothetical protein
MAIVWGFNFSDNDAQKNPLKNIFCLKYPKNIFLSKFCAAWLIFGVNVPKKCGAEGYAGATSVILQRVRAVRENLESGANI